MQKTLALVLASTILVAGCGGWRDSRVNPTNWFGKSEPTPVDTVAAAEEVNPLIPTKTRLGLFDRPPEVDDSVLVSQVTELRVEPTPTGAIVFATGLANRQGAFDVDLVPRPTSKDGVLEFDFRADYPENPTITGSAHSRTVRVAETLSKQDLVGIRTIRVIGAENARETRRR